VACAAVLTPAICSVTADLHRHGVTVTCVCLLGKQQFCRAGRATTLTNSQPELQVIHAWNWTVARCQPYTYRQACSSSAFGGVDPNGLIASARRTAIEILQ
jgi:hypothetical protein